MRVVLCVTNDIVTDQRVCRIAGSLLKLCPQVTIIGRHYKKNMGTGDLPCRIYRMRLLFHKGPLFYAEYNFRLLMYLLFVRADILVANDLDTLAAVYVASRIRRKTIIYDSHEYFTEVPELISRPLTRRIWQILERSILPKLAYMYTVSDSIAMDYNKKYGIEMAVIRNFPLRLKKTVRHKKFLRTGDDKIILYQGSLNIGRGLELTIRAVQQMDNVKLIIIGTGDVEDKLRKLVHILGVQDKVSFLGRIPQKELVEYTVQADIGISLEETMGLNYYYALPNKLFDYIQAEVPVIVSDLPEMAAVVRHYDIGMVAQTVDSAKLAGLFTEMLHNTQKRKYWKENLKKAAEELCWEREEHKLLELYRKATIRA